jgi:hypothetical protein
METIGQAINNIMNIPLPVMTLPYWLCLVLTVAMLAVFAWYIARSLIIID